MSWSRPFDDPITLPGGCELVTLEEAWSWLSGKCLHRQSGLHASPPTPKNSTIKNRGQLLSFLCAVAPNRTMSLQPPFHFGLA
jgi:hypothetical protein